MQKTGLVLGVLLLLIGGYVLITHNRLVAANETIDGQWAQVETQYQRRFDLIPNLVESVKGVMSQEEKIFGELAEARTRYAGATNGEQKVVAATEVEGALGRLLVVMENYPQLKSAENVQTLMSQLEGTENRVSVERGRYNDAVRDFNVQIKRVPAKWIAAMLGFDERSYFEAAKGAQDAPKVSL